MKAPRLFILDSAPNMRGLTSYDGTPVVQWADVCHGMKSNTCFINHSTLREVSRWTCEFRKRPYLVCTRNWDVVGASKTLDGALRIARRFAADAEALETK